MKYIQDILVGPRRGSKNRKGLIEEVILKMYGEIEGSILNEEKSMSKDKETKQFGAFCYLQVAVRGYAW